MTSQGVMRMGNSGLSSHDGKQFNMATVVSECAAVLCCLLEAVQAIEDPSSFQNFYTWVFRGLTTLKITATVRFHRPVRVKVVVFCVVFLAILPTRKEILIYSDMYLYSDMYRGVIFCAFIVSR
jgi:hypothetical protein